MIVGIIAIINPGTTVVFDALMAILLPIWFVVQGIVSIIVSIRARKVKKGWVAGLVLGILGVLVGLLTFFNPMISVVTIGILVGIFLIQAGLSMIVLATAIDTVDE